MEGSFSFLFFFFFGANLVARMAPRYPWVRQLDNLRPAGRVRLFSGAVGIAVLSCHQCQPWPLGVGAVQYYSTVQ